MKTFTDPACIYCANSLCDDCNSEAPHRWFVELSNGRIIKKSALDYTISGIGRSRLFVSAVNLSSVRVVHS